MRSDPLVSVVVPTYHRESMLSEAVQSVIEQTYPHVEIIVVDDASPVPASEALVDTDDSVRILRHDENQGANAARNTGIRAARGDILAFLDDDDRWAPTKLERQVTAFNTGHPRPGVVLVGQQFVDAGGSTIKRKLPAVDGTATEQLFAGTVAGPFSTMAVRRNLIDQAGLPDEKLPNLQDREWLLRLSQYAPFHSIRSPLVYRRMGDHDQIGDQFVERRDVTYQRMLMKHQETAAQFGLAGSFEASLALSVAAAALQNGAYNEARRFAYHALRSDPTAHRAYVYILAAIGGGFTYRPARSIKRHLTRLTPR